jgi:nucleotide-binding universal stress UspA family protein
LDGSSLAECVLSHVVAVARAFNAQVSLLHVLERGHTVGRPAPIDPLSWHIGKAEARAYLDDVADRLRQVGLDVETSLLEGQAARTVVEFGADHDVGLVFLSSHGRSGLSGWNVSSVAQQVILRIRRSIMIVRAYQPTIPDLTGVHYQRVLVPLDGSPRAESVLPAVTSLARFHGASVVAAHVVTRPEMLTREPLPAEDAGLVEQLVQRNWREAGTYLDQLKSRLPMELDTRLVHADNLALGLHDLVEHEHVDLVVMSAHGYSGTARFPYGSVVASFIAYGSTPLLIVQDLSPAELQPTQAEVLASESKGH